MRNPRRPQASRRFGSLRRTAGSRLLLIAAAALLAASCAALDSRPGQASLPDPYEPDIPANADPPVVRLGDGKREIVLIGTIHFVPSELADRLLELPPALYADIDAADLVLVESDLVVLDPIQRLMMALEVTRSLEHADSDRGRPSLKELLEARPDRAIDTVSLLAGLFGDEHENRAEEIAQLRPWAARMRIGTHLRDDSDVDWRSGLDDHIARRARKSGVDIEYLERWEELAELQDRADQEPYIESVLFTLGAEIDREVMIRTRSNHALKLVERWSRSQLAGFETTTYEMLGIEIPESVRRAWREHDSLVFDVRERAWAARILDRIERDGVRRMVVAVGAAHLIDDRAILIELLTEAGFEKTSPVR